MAGDESITVGGRTYTPDEFRALLHACGGAPPMMLAEALASVGLSRDPHAQTYAVDQPPSITCPVCDMTSYSPRDRAEGYCGNCHAFTSTPEPTP